MLEVQLETERLRLRSWLPGDRDAFDFLLRRHYDRIYRVAWRLTGSRTDAQYIAQEVCCTLVEKIGGKSGHYLRGKK
jgi:RNA polymerase sigma-70 factor (ECF subfamily)